MNSGDGVRVDGEAPLRWVVVPGGSGAKDKGGLFGFRR